MKQTPDHLRLFTRWHFYGVLVAFLLALHGSAMAAPQILVAHPVVHGLAQELVRGTSIELVRVTPAQLPPARHPAFLAGRGLEALQKAAVQAEAVLTLRSIWPDDQLYPLARRNNIRIVEIDAAQPVEGDLPGISLSTGDNAINAQPWLDGNNLSRMSGILADALARLHPPAASVLQANRQAVQGQLQKLAAGSSQRLARLTDLGALVLSRRVHTLAQALQLEMLPWTNPVDEAQLAPALSARLQQEKARVVLHHTRPDAAVIEAIEANGARLVVIPEFSGNPVEALEKAVQMVLEGLESRPNR